MEALKKKVIKDTKLQLNCLTYLQFAQSLGECNQLDKNDFHFNLLTCELGPILFLNRNIIFKYFYVLLLLSKPNHIDTNSSLINLWNVITLGRW